MQSFTTEQLERSQQQWDTIDIDLVRDVSWLAVPGAHAYMTSRATISFTDAIKAAIGSKSSLVVAAIACGDMCGENSVLQNFDCGRIDGYDLSQESLKKAINLYADKTPDFKPIHVDCNSIKLPENEYDLVIGFHGIHHIYEIDKLFQQICTSLKPDGVFAMFEWIGPEFLQIPPEKTAASIALLRSQFSAEEVTTHEGLIKGDWIQHPPEMFDPSEACNSQEIVPTLEKYFEPLYDVRFGGLLYPMFEGCGSNKFLHESPTSESRIEKIAIIEDQLTQAGLVKPLFITSVAAKKAKSCDISPLSCFIPCPDSAEQACRDIIARSRVHSSYLPYLLTFVQEGYVILPGAVEDSLCDKIVSEMTSAYRSDQYNVLAMDSLTNSVLPACTAPVTQSMRYVDIHVPSKNAKRALFSPRITEFLRLIFETDPLLFQSISFDKGSQQDLHQDTAYVVVSKPKHFAAAWIALEDIHFGSGELVYIPGSHKISDFFFSNAYLHWDRSRDGLSSHKAWQEHMLQECSKLSLEPIRFTPRKGDALIWSASLIHGGCEITKNDYTRKSLVGHYCPTGVIPNYLRYSNPLNMVYSDVDSRMMSTYHYLGKPDAWDKF